MFSNRTLLIATLVTGWLGLPVYLSHPTEGKTERLLIDCPSGRSETRLTGWSLNGKFPSGSASFDRATGILEVSVDSIALPNGKVLAVLVGEDRIGELGPLQDGKATGKISHVVADDARVRVFDGERPVLSANLRCSQTVLSTPTITPSPTPTVTSTPTPVTTPSPTPTPSPTVSPGPTAEPTQDPMPKPSPFPTPSP